MNKFLAVENIDAVFSAKQILPTITLWNRLEGRPRTHDFKRALRAELRDALWMLTKQWQMGEFEGDDAGSPIAAKIHFTTTELTKYRPAGHAVAAFDDDVPLEAKVERRAIPFEAAAQPLSLDIRLLMGRRWLKLVSGIEGGIAEKFIGAYSVVAPDPANPDDAPICAHPEAWQRVAAFAGRAMDGYRLYAYLKADAGHHASNGLALANPGAVDALEAPFVAWFEALFYQPADPQERAWLPERMEYAFDCSAPRGGGELVLTAEQYYQGRLDWYNFDIDASGDPLPDPATPPPAGVEEATTNSFIPVPISFDGMPNTRWWTFEDGRTNFGDIDPDTTDVNKLLLMEFGLVYANDWFLLPITVPAGTVIAIGGLAVTNTFGERTWIEASGRGDDEDWQRWAMFALNTKGSDAIPADLSLLVLPTTPKIQESEPFETVELVRDEVANMVWAVETKIPLPTGDTRSGRTAGFETRAFHDRFAVAPPPGPPVPVNDAAIRYQLMTAVPEHWIPFIPVHIPGGNREVQLRRAAMPRLVRGLPPDRIRPRTTLIREGLDRTPAQSLTIHEEEVPRGGATVSQSFQRVRWYDGQTFIWFGARKQTGRGEKSSGLAFDQIPPKPAQP